MRLIEGLLKMNYPEIDMVNYPVDAFHVYYTITTTNKEALFCA